MKFNGARGMMLTLAVTFLWYILDELVLRARDDKLLYLIMGVINGIGGYWFGHVYDRLRKLSMIDPLTKVYNRHFFTLELKRQLALAQRRGYFISLAIIDLDNFKAYNDRYGHLDGDRLLYTIADFLQRSLRKSDIIARYGGDEFVLILPHTDSAQALSLMRRIRDTLASGDLTEGKITLSIGISTYPGGTNTAEELLNKADNALYSAKEQRNEIRLYSHFGLVNY